MTKTWLPYDEYMKTINPNWIPKEQYLKQQQAKRAQYIEALKKISMRYDSYLTLAKYADGCTQKYDKNMELGDPKPLLVIDAVTEKEHWNYTDGPRFPTTCVHGHAYVGDVQNRVFKAGYGYDKNNVFQKPDPADNCHLCTLCIAPGVSGSSGICGSGSGKISENLSSFGSPSSRFSTLYPAGGYGAQISRAISSGASGRRGILHAHTTAAGL